MSAVSPPMAVAAPSRALQWMQMRVEIVLMLAGLLAFVLFPQDLGLLTNMATMSIFALSLSLVLGQAGIATFGQAALYGAGVPIRLANDRYEQFQSGIKRHAFDIRYQLAVDKKDNSFKIFRADMSCDGGGRINYSPSVAAVGATAAQSIYYMPQNDLSVTAYHSRGVEAGSMRGYGTLQTMAATEMMVDECWDHRGSP